MFRRNFLFRLIGMLGGLVGLGGERAKAGNSVPCPDCGKPARPRRRYKDATEYACTECGKDLPLGAFMFTLRDNDPRHYAFFPLDIEKMFRPDVPFRPLFPGATNDFAELRSGLFNFGAATRGGTSNREETSGR